MNSLICLEPGEQLIFEDLVEAKNSKQKPFVFGVTDRAVLFLQEKHFARESWRIERIPLTNIVQVFLARQKRWFMLALSAFLFLTGLVMCVIMMKNQLYGVPGSKASGVPFGLLVAGLVLPFISKGRRILVVQTKDKLFKWKPQLVVDKKSRARIESLQQNAIAACRQAGIHIMEEAA